MARKMQLLVLTACAIFLAAPASAQDAEAFFKGKTLSTIIGYPAGGGFDASARLLLRHMGRHIPGNPTIVPKNRPGAGSTIAANYLFNAAPKDGTEFGLIGGSVPFGPLWGRTGVNFEATKFNWIGSMDRWVGIAAMWHAAPVITLEGARTQDVTVGATGAGDVTVIYPRVLNAIIGTRFKIASGYRGSPDLNLAIERGEVAGRLGWCWDCLKAEKPNWVEEKTIRIMIQLGLQKEPELEGVPFLFDLVKDEADLQILRVVFGSQEMARPFVAPPGVPADRMNVLRGAFEATLADPAFLAEAKQLHLPVRLTKWREMEKLISDVYATPQPIVERAVKLIGGK